MNDTTIIQENTSHETAGRGVVGSGVLLGELDLRLTDCMELMRDTPDKAYDLAIVDPPYGIGEDGAKNHSRGNAAPPTLYTPKSWDREIPTAEYFAELKRVSRHQIIWGGNYFPLPPTSCWVVWDKENGDNDFADCELAWTSFKTAVRKFRFRWAGMLQGNMAKKEKRIHPTQKPVALYSWLLNKYAKRGQRILDTHMGSGSIAIACYNHGYALTACEIDKDYYDQAIERIKRETGQLRLLT
jgi:site-specific DNA-methyltransferase (adenine-specific)